MSQKHMTSWELRRRRTKKITVCTVIFFIVLAALVLCFLMLRPYETWDLKQFYTLSFSGYDGKGSAEAVLDEEKLAEALDTLKEDHKNALIRLRSCTDRDYDAFRNSMQAILLSQDSLKNGDSVRISYTCDETLAKKLNLNVHAEEETVTVTGLPVVTVLTAEDLFRDVSIVSSGISPDVQVTIENNSRIPFLQGITLQPDDPKESYAEGDVITLRAYYSEEEALAAHYAVDTPSGECVKEYTVTADSSYITDASMLSSDFVKQAASVGLSAFTDANEYGVRIFCEAGLVPVYVNKQATFEWVSPTYRSAYLKCTREEYLKDSENHFNDLDIIYECTIRQANGVTCPCYAVVRFYDLVVNADGSISCDLSYPKVMSADYRLENINKTVIHAFEGTHTVTKVSER